jgi:hypothetical protein
MTILLLAANTSFGGFPRLAMILARDRFMPKQMMNLGDRLVFSNGIVLLGTMAIALVIAFHANVHALMPMYAIGVFLSFTIAQAGMVVRHMRAKLGGESRRGMIVNGIGACATAVVCLLLCIEKFAAGAWLVIVFLPVLVWAMNRAKKHYDSWEKQLFLPKDSFHPASFEHTVLVLVASLNKGVVPAIQYAKSISQRVEAVHVELNPADTEQLEKAWNEWGCGIKLTVLKSPYRSFSEPLLKYIDEVESRHDHDVVTVVIPEFVSKSWWHNLMHNQTAIAIKTALLFRPGKVVTTIRYHLKE